jgi:gliding motility-associated-like protein
LGGAFQNTTGVYNDTILNGGYNGCDSLITTTLTVNPIPINSTTANICQGDSILIGSVFQTTAGVYNDTILGGSFNGCDSIISTSLTVSPLGDASINLVNTMCSGDASTTLSAANSGGVWTGNGITNTNSGDFDPSIAGVGTHQIIYTISGNCGDADTINITVNPSPTVSITTVDDNCEEGIGEINTLLLTGISPISYSWDNGATTSSINNLSQGVYTLILSDSTGCTSTYQTTINDMAIDCQFHIYLPNVFSPNNDGENDVLFVRGKGIESVQLVIYNRWGNKVFETNDIAYGWDGTYNGNELNSAVFVYFIEATFTNGQSITDKGNVSIVK